jgi:predicted nucleotidyltransferase
LRDDLKFLVPLVKQAQKMLDLKSIRVFGSFARGDFTQSSDVDLAFEFNKRDDERWVKFKLWVADDFRSLRFFDLLDLNEVDETFYKSIISEGVILYE